MMQSKAMEDLRKGNSNPSNFVLQLPANYRQADQEVTGNTAASRTALLSVHSDQSPSAGIRRRCLNGIIFSICLQ